MKQLDEDLWTNYANLVYGYMTKDKFETALAEHDRETIKAVDKFFTEIEETLDICLESKSIENGCRRCQDYYKSKAELKQKLEITK